MPTPTVNFQYKRNIRSAASRKLSRVSDGDTPVIEQPIRMVSCDTPEKAGYAGKPETSQPKLDRCRERMEGSFYNELPLRLREYLNSKLTGDAAQRHIDAGNEATNIFNTILDERLTRPDGKKRSVATIPTGEIIDKYSRLLAYIAPWFSNTPGDPLPPRDSSERWTFNLNMIGNGWAAFFPIYPSLPGNEDMNLAIKAAESAWDSKIGIWAAYGSNVLLGYEFRACIKLGTAENGADGIKSAFERICVDLRDLRIVGKFGFPEVPPCYRLWVWEKDIVDAKRDLGLIE